MAKDAHKEKDKAAAAETAPEGAGAAPAKKGPMKLVMLVAGVLLLEAGTVVVTMYLKAGPAKVHGHTMEQPADANMNELAELLVIKDQFASQRTGRTMLYDTEVFITVKKSESDKVKKQVESMQAQLATDIGTIIRRAEPAHLLEPTLATLNRQIKAALDERLGRDAKGEPVAHEVLIRKWIGILAG